MQPLLATQYGNFVTFLIAGPALLLGLFIGVLAWLGRIRPLAVISGLGCVGIGFVFLSSLPEAMEVDRGVTVQVAVVSVLAGLALMFTKRKRKM